MIEIVAAVSAASGAFNTIKAGFAAGREIESMAGDLSRWMGAVSDIKKAEEYNKKPPLFKKLFNAGSVEEEAMEIFMPRKKQKICEMNSNRLSHLPEASSGKKACVQKQISVRKGNKQFTTNKKDVNKY